MVPGTWRSRTSFPSALRGWHVQRPRLHTDLLCCAGPHCSLPPRLLPPLMPSRYHGSSAIPSTTSPLVGCSSSQFKFLFLVFKLILARCGEKLKIGVEASWLTKPSFRFNPDGWRWGSDGASYPAWCNLGSHKKTNENTVRCGVFWVIMLIK